MRKKTNEILRDILCVNSGYWMLARDVTYACRVYNRSVNPKAVGKRMLELEDNGYAERQYHSNMETRAIGARYSYKWLGWKIGSRQQNDEGINLAQEASVPHISGVVILF